MGLAMSNRYEIQKKARPNSALRHLEAIQVNYTFGFLRHCFVVILNRRGLCYFCSKCNLEFSNVCVFIVGALFVGYQPWKLCMGFIS